MTAVKFYTHTYLLILYLTITLVSEYLYQTYVCFFIFKNALCFASNVENLTINLRLFRQRIWHQKPEKIVLTKNNIQRKRTKFDICDIESNSNIAMVMKI